MSGKTIGTAFNHGFAGSYARQPNMTINTKPNTGYSLRCACDAEWCWCEIP